MIPYGEHTKSLKLDIYTLLHCKNIKFVLNHGMVISVASSLVFTVISLCGVYHYNWWSIFSETERMH